MRRSIDRRIIACVRHGAEDIYRNSENAHSVCRRAEVQTAFSAYRVLPNSSYKIKKFFLRKTRSFSSLAHVFKSVFRLSTVFRNLVIFYSGFINRSQFECVLLFGKVPDPVFERDLIDCVPLRCQGRSLRFVRNSAADASGGET